MKKAGIFIILSMIIIAFVWASSFSQEDVLRIDNSAFENPERVPSIFDHEQHLEVVEWEECNICHHVYEDGKKVEDESSEDQRCSECHEVKSSGDTPSLMKAYHLRCKICHMTIKSGPVMCGECHLKGPVKKYYYISSKSSL